jgi:hypothetical protein
MRLLASFVATFLSAGVATAQPADKPAPGGSPDAAAASESGDESTTGAQAQKAKPKRSKPAKKTAPNNRPPPSKLTGFAQLMIGFGSAPIPGTQDQTGSGTSFTLQPGGRYQLSEPFALSLRLPLSLVVTQEPGDTATRGVLGNPMLGAEYAVSLSRTVRVPLALGLGIPIASGELDPTATDSSAFERARANAYADAAHGYRESELFVVKRLPVTLSAGVEYRGDEIDLFGSTGVLLAPSLSGDLETPNVGVGTWEKNALAVRSVTAGGVAWNFLPDPALWIGLDAWLSVEAVRPIELSTPLEEPPSRAQFVIEPKLAAQLGWLRPSLGFLAPLGGPLGNAGTRALRLRADGSF